MTDYSHTDANSTRTTADNPFGKVLASGIWDENAVPLWWAIYLIGAVALLATFAYSAHVWNDRLVDMRQQIVNVQRVPGESWEDASARTQDQRAQELNRAELMIVMSSCAVVLLPVLCLLTGVLYHRSIVGTHIQVAETGIVGKGVGKYFLWGDPRLFGFRLPYNQVTSVDVGGSTLIVHASGAQYKCYVKNPADIQRVIVEQQQKRS